MYRPSAKELLKHRFIKNARKSARLLERIRERPKVPIGEGAESVRNGDKPDDDGSGTVKVSNDSRYDATAQASHGEIPGNAGWDFSTVRTQGTGTVRSAVRPTPSVATREKSDVPSVLPRKPPDRGSPVSGRIVHESSSGTSPGKDARDQYDGERREDSVEDEVSFNSSGTVVFRSPREILASASFNDQSPMSSSRYDEGSGSGTVVIRGQHSDSDTPRTPKSILGVLERTSSAANEDSATNLAEAKAALQAGQRKVNVRERFVRGKINKDGHEARAKDRASTPNSSRYTLNFIKQKRMFPNLASHNEMHLVSESPMNPLEHKKHFPKCFE
ncbi:hypothetical protein ACLOJK_039354 [Asimina triloba]